jgi:hypothetical protein
MFAVAFTPHAQSFVHTTSNVVAVTFWTNQEAKVTQ